MTVLAPPVADPAGSEAASNDHNSCGLRAAASIIRTTDDPAGLRIPDVAWAVQIVAGVEAFGHGWHAAAAWPTDVGAFIRESIAQDRYVIESIWCTGQAEPVPASQASASHWLDVFGDAGECFNDWRQTFPTYSLPTLVRCYEGRVGCVQMWRDPTPASNQTSTGGGTPTPEDDMFTDADRALLQQIASKQAAGVVVFFQCQDATFKSVDLEVWEWMPNQQAINDARAVALANGFKVLDWPGGNVADPFAFGDPKTQHDADVAKVTYP